MGKPQKKRSRKSVTIRAKVRTRVKGPNPKKRRSPVSVKKRRRPPVVRYEQGLRSKRVVTKEQLSKIIDSQFPERIVRRRRRTLSTGQLFEVAKATDQTQSQEEFLALWDEDLLGLIEETATSLVAATVATDSIATAMADENLPAPAESVEPAGESAGTQDIGPPGPIFPSCKERRR